MTLFGDGRAALLDDAAGAERLAWPRRRRSLPDPSIVLQPRAGDPRREPWIAPPGWRPTPGPVALWQQRRGGGPWRYLPAAPGVDRYLARCAEPVREGGAVVGIFGLGRVGGTAATVLAATPVRRSGIAELLIHDCDPANYERWQLELSSIAEWHAGEPLPALRAVSLDEMLQSCDAFVFSAAACVPPLGTAGDVRLTQFGPNRAILAHAVRSAREARFAGLFLIVSDPVECLAQAAFVDSNIGPDGRFAGDGLAPERIAGIALGVMWGRAMAAARRLGCAEAFARHGAAYGPHSTEVAIFDDLRAPDPTRSAALADAARRGNYQIRQVGFLPYVGPGVSSVALTLPRLLAGREALASVFLDGIFFGCPARLTWGVVPARRPLAPTARTELDVLWRLVSERMADLGLLPG